MAGRIGNRNWIRNKNFYQDATNQRGRYPLLRVASGDESYTPIESNFRNSLAASNCMLLSSEYNLAANCVRFPNYTRKILYIAKKSSGNETERNEQIYCRTKRKTRGKKTPTPNPPSSQGPAVAIAHAAPPRSSASSGGRSRGSPCGCCPWRLRAAAARRPHSPTP